MHNYTLPFHFWKVSWLFQLKRHVYEIVITQYITRDSAVQCSDSNLGISLLINVIYIYKFDRFYLNLAFLTVKMDRGDVESVRKIGDILNDQNLQLAERFRALFTLRNLGGETAISCIGKSFSDPSALLKHESAYCLGQMQDERAIPLLTSVLEDDTQETIVRHEAGEWNGMVALRPPTTADQGQGLRAHQGFNHSPLVLAFSWGCGGLRHRCAALISDIVCTAFGLEWRIIIFFR